VGAKADGITGSATSATGPFDSSTDNENYLVAVKYGEVTVTDQKGNDDAEDNEKLAAGDAPHAIDDVWAGSVNARDNTNDDDEVVSTEKVITYTNVEAPTNIPFVVDDDGKGRYTLDANDDEGNSQSLTFSMSDHSGKATLTDSRVTVPAPDGTATLVGEDDDETKDMKENEYQGTFDGAEGTFTCTGGASGCAVTVEDGKITNMVNVHFTPEEDATVSEPDGDFLHYGFWVKSSEDKMGDPVYEIQTFAGGMEPFAALSTLTGRTGDAAGSATYEGTAGGVYSQKIAYDSTTGKLVSGHVGAFTADVNLKAYFGTSPDVAVNKQNAIEGTVSNFMDGDFEIGFPDAELITKKFNADDGETSGGKGTVAGVWSASFFGPSAAVDHDDNPDTDEEVPMPSGVAGTFNANFDNGSVAGGYGANKK
jgi:hypothetical protein